MEPFRFYCGAGGEANRHLEELLAESVEFHGHLCPGQVLGVRMVLAAACCLRVAGHAALDGAGAVQAGHFTGVTILE